MGDSVIEQIYLPNCLCASGIKPTKSQISKEDWTFKLARSTYAQWPRASPRTLPRYHHEQPRCFPRALPLPTANSPGAFRGPRRFPPSNSPSPRAPGAFREPRRFPPRTAPVLSASTRPRIILLSPAIPLNPAPPHPHHSPKPCLFKSPPGHILSLSILTSK